MFPDKSKHNQYDYLNYLYKQANEQMKDKGIVSYQVFNPKNKNIIKGYEVREGELGDFLVVGSDGTYTPQQYIDRALKQLEVGGLPGKFNACRLPDCTAWSKALMPSIPGSGIKSCLFIFSVKF